ncbi:hypothetical protein [Mycoplasmopsis synoviae]|uniref:Uncharacterized protein n=1 Tax=Mycoplasmopsis synoviae TaxID=2109 RepID=A0AAX3EZC1_MYCSY|nr:hypothetical protein [Mycoplasmopsis synoviae]UZF64215.1 hypothetical protein N0B76_03075 [Mycoplasmopsis synoviae]UZF64886.1 hypothetical protein N0B75_03075 [Mycoplasmopsis synoviae]UZF65558.1 hypothetical protein N0B74_03080 [Mycoplasmopsis synoviae]UZW64365.1 hypothetical protein OIE46_03275 [Mycoplasmopsis synoviae]
MSKLGKKLNFSIFLIESWKISSKKYSNESFSSIETILFRSSFVRATLSI